LIDGGAGGKDSILTRQSNAALTVSTYGVDADGGTHQCLTEENTAFRGRKRKKVRARGKVAKEGCVGRSQNFVEGLTGVPSDKSLIGKRN